MCSVIRCVRDFKTALTKYTLKISQLASRLCISANCSFFGKFFSALGIILRCANRQKGFIYFMFTFWPANPWWSGWTRGSLVCISIVLGFLPCVIEEKAHKDPSTFIVNETIISLSVFIMRYYPYEVIISLQNHWCSWESNCMNSSKNEVVLANVILACTRQCNLKISVLKN